MAILDRTLPGKGYLGKVKKKLVKVGGKYGKTSSSQVVEN